jgi:cyclic beta-1,2-glucan synthetase
MTALGLPDAVLPAMVRAGALIAIVEVLLLGIGLAMDRRWTRGFRLHGVVVLGALLAALTPVLADFGTHRAIAEAPIALQWLPVVATAAISQAGLWAITFLVTGLFLDALRGRRPTAAFSIEHWHAGLTRGAIYGGVFMLVIHVTAMFLAQPVLVDALVAHPLIGSALLGALVFPLGKTILESFDGSAPFFHRLPRAFVDPRNYLRGALAGAVLGELLAHDLPAMPGGKRFLLGLGVGALAYAGADLLWDFGAILRGDRQRLHSWRIYALGAALGGFVAGALAWYFDAAQLAAVTAKFWSYAAVNFPVAGKAPADYVVYPLFSKWGAINLGAPEGGVRLFYAESLSGVINWSFAAPLFGVNLVVLNALFQRSLKPLKELLSGAGASAMVEQTIRVLRWGLWMAPVIYTFLRLAPDPTWYNQDGAIRTIVATVQSWILSPEDFRAWSLAAFLGLLAYDWLRVLIWFDHMGLRVATLVNLSFVGGDVLDEKAARFAGHSARTRIIPEGIRRFLTWAPLLIPFYIPRGVEWDYVWAQAEPLGRSAEPMLPAVSVLMAGYAVAAVGVVALVAFFLIRSRRATTAVAPRPKPLSIGNGLVTAELHPDGRGYSRVFSQVRGGYVLDVTKRPDDPFQLRGKFFYLRALDEGPEAAAWSLAQEPMRITGPDYAVTRISPTHARIVNSHAGIRVEAQITVDDNRPVERWQLRLTNLESRPRRIELTSFQELALSGVDAYRRTPAFAALHVGTWFLRPLAAIVYRNRLLRDAGQFRVQRMSREVGYHCACVGPESKVVAYEDSRAAFLGSGTARTPRATGGYPMRETSDEGLLYTFDPAASLRVEVALAANASAQVEFIDGYAIDLPQALEDIAAHVGARNADAESLAITLSHARRLHALPSPKWHFSDAGVLNLDGAAPRPWTHVMSNPLGDGMVVGSDGEMFSFAGNAQQNALTPLQLDAIPSQSPAQAIYVVDLDTHEVDTAGFIPYRRGDAMHDATFGRGYATWRKTRGPLVLEQTAFVAIDQPAQVCMLRIRNDGAATRRLRIVSYAQIVLAEVAADSNGGIDVEEEEDVLLYRRLANDFRKGWAFAATNLAGAVKETSRARFVGRAGHDLESPHFAEHGCADALAADDGDCIAAFAATIEIESAAETVVTFVLGQAPSRREAAQIARSLQDPVTAQQGLERVQAFWTEQLGALRIETNSMHFDRLVNDWLPYQLLCSRLWGRAGPSQRSGAFGFRDQLQDVLPLVFTRPDLARAQIVLHASQQFLAGDVVKWWHPSWEGKTGVAVRTAASDPQLWLPYVVARYVAATGDASVLDVEVPFLEGRALAPGQEGIVFVPRPSRERGSVYEHCRRAIEWSLARLGPRGIPLMGSGDWNDGLDVCGIEGRGESGWLGFFLHDVLTGFVPLAHKHEGEAAAARYREQASSLRVALEVLWRGESYVRLVADDGQEILEASALMAAWPVLSGAVDLDRGIAALENSLREIEKQDRVLLSASAFTENSHPYPGRLADYPPGVRENGGQYSHGVSWIVDAYLRCAELADARNDGRMAQRCRDRAAEIWIKISPLSKFENADTAALYGLPPHQQAADVYHGRGYEGRGGWAWYTGAAARMLSSAYALVGLRMENGELKLAPHASRINGGIRLKRVTYRGRSLLPGASE